MRSVEQILIQDVSAANDANTTVTKDNASTLVNTSEISEDVIEVSTQKSVMSKAKQSLQLKRKIPVQHIDFGLCHPLSKHTFTQTDDKSLMNTALNTLKDKINISYCLSPIKTHNKIDLKIEKSIKIQKEDELLINKVKKDKVLKIIQNIKDFACEDETFYLPAEQAAANINDMDNFNLDDTENKPLEKNKLLDKFNVASQLW